MSPAPALDIVTLNDLTLILRNRLKDWAQQNSFTAILAANTGVNQITLAYTHTGFCTVGDILMAGGERLYVQELLNTPTIATVDTYCDIIVRRGWNGSLPEAHPIGQIIHNGVRWDDGQLSSALKDGIPNLYPYFFNRASFSFPGDIIGEYNLTTLAAAADLPLSSINFVERITVNYADSQEPAKVFVNGEVTEEADGVMLRTKVNLFDYTVTVGITLRKEAPAAMDETIDLPSRAVCMLLILWGIYSVVPEREIDRVNSDDYQNVMEGRGTPAGAQLNTGSYWREKFYREAENMSDSRPGVYLHWAR